MMTVTEEFKTALRSGNLAEALVVAMSQAIELKITTWVGDSHLQTQINLIQGTIKNEISEQFVASNIYKELQEFHFSQVNNANQTIQNNLESLEKMFRLLASLQKQKSCYQNSSELASIDTVETSFVPSLSETSLISPEIEPSFNLTQDSENFDFTNFNSDEPVVETGFASTMAEDSTISPEIEVPFDISSNLQTKTTENTDSEISDFANFSLETPAENAVDDEDWGDFLNEIDDNSSENEEDDWENN